MTARAWYLDPARPAATAEPTPEQKLLVCVVLATGYYLALRAEIELLGVAYRYAKRTVAGV